ASAWLNLDSAGARADVVSDGQRGSFWGTSLGWPQVVGHLSHVTRHRPTLEEAGRTASIDEHALHHGHSMTPAQGHTVSPTASRMIPGLADKPRNLPASYYTATTTLARSTLKKEWVDIPVGDVRVHTWVEYPDGNSKAGVVIV